MLDRGTAPSELQRVATFHRHGDAPNAWSDLFIPFEAYPVGFDQDGCEIWVAEGSDIYQSDGLDDVWQEITRIAQERKATQGVIWISNLGG
jgi:hypothetical protein